MNTKTTTPGKGLLKVSGILFIVFGSIAAVVAAFAVFGSAALSGMDTALEGFAAAAMLVSMVALISSLLNIAVGIVGVKFCDKPEKAGICLGFGIGLIVIQLISAFISGFSLSVLIGLALPVLYVIGACKNKSVEG